MDRKCDGDNSAPIPTELVRMHPLKNILGHGNFLPFSKQTLWEYVRAGILKPPGRLGRVCVYDEPYLLEVQQKILSGTLVPFRQPKRVSNRYEKAQEAVAALKPQRRQRKPKTKALVEVVPGEVGK